MAYRVWCDTCDNYGDVPTFEAAEDWEDAHQERFPGHDSGAEFYPSMVEPITPAAAVEGGF